jgi:hypothetical protein
LKGLSFRARHIMPPSDQTRFQLKAVCSNPRHKRESRTGTSITPAERVAFSVALNRIYGCATNRRHCTKKGSLGTVVPRDFARREHPINLPWTLKGTKQ